MSTATLERSKQKPHEAKPPQEPKEPKKPVRSGVGKMFYLDEELAKAFEAFMEHQRLPVSQTTVFEAALKMFLKAEGFWPPPKDNP